MEIASYFRVESPPSLVAAAVAIGLGVVLLWAAGHVREHGAPITRMEIWGRSFEYGVAACVFLALGYAAKLPHGIAHWMNALLLPAVAALAVAVATVGVLYDVWERSFWWARVALRLVALVAVALLYFGVWSEDGALASLTGVLVLAAAAYAIVAIMGALDGAWLMALGFALLTASPLLVLLGLDEVALGNLLDLGVIALVLQVGGVVALAHGASASTVNTNKAVHPSRATQRQAVRVPGARGASQAARRHPSGPNGDVAAHDSASLGGQVPRRREGAAAQGSAEPAVGPSAPVASRPAEAGPPAGWTGFKKGSVLDERYRLEAKLGEGGMAVVYRAHDLMLDEQVALKVFTQQVLDEEAMKRFVQELRMTRKLRHTNIIQYFDIGAFLGHKYISMELLAGRDMHEYFRGPVDLKQGLHWMIQACRGLHAAHEFGIVHRDVKPHNLFVGDDGVVKVMDFGIAKQASTNITTDKMIAGTPDYISPEQISGFSSVTPAADQYALGVTMFQAFTGRLPFVHDEPMPLLMMHVNDAPPDPRSVNPALPAALAEVILKLMSKDPAARYASCDELARTLDALRTQLP